MRADRQRRLLQPLPGLRPERVGAGQPLAVAEQGQESVGLGVVVRVGGGLRHVRQRGGGAVSRLGGAHRGGLRVGVGDAGNGLVVRRARLAGDVRRDNVALVLADVGQRPDAGDVADRPQPLTCPQVLVNVDPFRVRLDAHGLQADSLHPRAPAGRHQQPVTPPVGPVRELEDVLIALPPGGAGVHPEHQLDPVAAQGLGQRRAERRGLARQHPVGALDDHHLAAETADDLRELDPGRPAAEHEQAARHDLHAGRLAGAPDALKLSQPRDRGHEVIRAGRHDDVLGGVPDPVDLDHAGAGQPPRAPQQGDAAAGEPVLLPGVGPVRHHVVAPGQRVLNVDLGGGARLARAVHRLARAQQRLRRDARPVGALAAH